VSFDVKTAPIQFRRAEPGVYLSTCGRSHDVRARAVELVDRRHGYTMEHAPSPAAHRAEYDAEEDRLLRSLESVTTPWDACPSGLCGRYRIHKTEHSGRSVTLSGRTRWWVTDVASGQAIGRSGMSSHQLTLEDSVAMLHFRIGRAVEDAFDVLKAIRRETAERDRVARVRAEREEAVSRILSDGRGRGLSTPAIAALVVDWLEVQKSKS
jgi:hypothetical protein